MTQMVDTSQWRIERHIPMAVVIGLMLNFGALVWTAAQFEARLGAIERQQGIEATEIKDLNAARESLALHLEHLDDNVQTILATASRIEAAQDRASGRISGAPR